MKEFQYFKLYKDMDIDYILLTSTEDVYFLYHEIYAQLVLDKGKQFSIVIDLLLRNGYTFNRFVLLEFYEDNVTSKIMNPREVSENLKNNTRLYLQQNSELLINSALSNSTINFILYS